MFMNVVHAGSEREKHEIFDKVGSGNLCESTLGQLGQSEPPMPDASRNLPQVPALLVSLLLALGSAVQGCWATQRRCPVRCDATMNECFCLLPPLIHLPLLCFCPAHLTRQMSTVVPPMEVVACLCMRSGNSPS